MKTARVQVGNIGIGAGRPLVLIAGPCVIESESMCMSLAKALKAITEAAGVPFIFKASYDKANRLSLGSFRGPGIKRGLEILHKVKQKFKVPVLSDVHCPKDMQEAATVLDVIQIPAFLCRQTDMITAAAKTGKVVNIKKGQFLAPWDMQPIVKKAEANKAQGILITERGVSFGYNNLVTDFRSIAVMRAYGYPVIYDATHSIQLPGGKGGCSGGQREFVAPLCRAAAAFGCDGLFLEVHARPEEALCDGPNMLALQDLEPLLRQVRRIEGVL